MALPARRDMPAPAHLDYHLISMLSDVCAVPHITERCSLVYLTVFECIRTCLTTVLGVNPRWDSVP